MRLMNRAGIVRPRMNRDILEEAPARVWFSGNPLPTPGPASGRSFFDFSDQDQSREGRAGGVFFFSPSSTVFDPGVLPFSFSPDFSFFFDPGRALGFGLVLGFAFALVLGFALAFDFARSRLE